MGRFYYLFEIWYYSSFKNNLQHLLSIKEIKSDFTTSIKSYQLNFCNSGSQAVILTIWSIYNSPSRLTILWCKCNELNLMLFLFKLSDLWFRFLLNSEQNFTFDLHFWFQNVENLVIDNFIEFLNQKLIVLP